MSETPIYNDKFEVIGKVYQREDGIVADYSFNGVRKSTYCSTVENAENFVRNASLNSERKTTSHRRCEMKKSWSRRKLALLAKNLARKQKIFVEIYKCNICSNFHLTHAE